MVGSDLDEVGWPACGEIDVMEYVGSQPTTVHGTVHGPGYAGLEHGIGKAYDAGTDLASGFHVYAVDWTAEQITWLLDGTVYQRLTPADVPGPWPFTQPFFLVINLAIGGAWPGNDTDRPSLPARMLIDWIRVHEHR
jgi:beta-glucanase (GH16 family)